MFESNKYESLDDKLEKEFQQYITNKQFSGEEIRESYYTLCGISEVEPNNRIKELTEKMEEMSQESFPINRFVKFIEHAELLEGATNRFEHYVSDLNISDNEKRLLNSIIKNKRTGILECHVDNDPKGKIEIKQNDNPNETALVLLYGLSKILSHISSEGGSSQHKAVDFWFEEE